MIYHFNVRWKSRYNLVPASHLPVKYEVSIWYVEVMFMPSSIPQLKTEDLDAQHLCLGVKIP
jgi:hypothetical protein